MSEIKFFMPEGVQKDEATATDNYARYEAGPFENGYAQTVGIALRRVLLSSIEGVAITAVRIKGADHEFTTVKGIAEDVTDIIIALKQVLIKTVGSIPERITISKKGPCTVTAGDFEAQNAVTIVNPELPIATVAAGGEFELEAEIAKGYGFHPANWNRPDEQIIGLIPIDSIHSPVTRVNFSADAKRVGDRTDYEKLVLEVWTDGRITPDEALHTGAELIRRHFDVFVGTVISSEALPERIEKVGIQSSASANGASKDAEKIRAILAMKISELELSVRSSNCLNREKIETVGALACKSEEEMLQYRNFGQKSLDEIRDKLKDLGLADINAIDPALLAPYRNA
jgi:DNA-directed RNA polymerase subunit alpha